MGTTEAGDLVGREPERAVLDAMLAGAADAPVVAYLHGPGGIGKSRLVRYAARRAEHLGRAVVHLDARHLDSDPRRLAEAAAVACAEPGAVLLVDTFEQGRSLEPWLRDVFLRRLAEGAVVVLASRVAPDVEWSLDPDWAGVFADLVVRPLDASRSDALLAARGVPADRRAAVAEFAGGSPLVLSLAASVTAGGAPWEPTGDVLTTLVERLAGDVPGPAHRRALEVLSQAYVTRESLLRAVLGEPDAAAVFPWLRRLPYVEVTPEGLHPHDAVRSTLAADLRWRDPERYEDVRVQVSVAGLHAVRRATGPDAHLRVAEWMYLFRDDCGPEDEYEWTPHPHVEDVPLDPDDVPALLHLTREYEGEAAAAAVEHWARRRPGDFRVFRYAGSAVPAAFVAFLQLAEVTPEDREADPVVAALWDFVTGTAPLAAGEHLSVRRFAVQPATPPSPFLDLIGRRAVAADMRDEGRAMSFVVVEDAERFRGFLGSAGLREVVTAKDGDREQHIFGRDWRRRPVQAWVRDRARPDVTPPAGWGDGWDRKAFADAVAEALRTWHLPREFAAGALPRAGLVPPGSPDPVAELRGVIEVALDALRNDPAGVRAYDVLTATYFAAARTHQAAARRLGVPYGTYRRHLAAARELLTAHLWRRRVSTGEQW